MLATFDAETTAAQASFAATLSAAGAERVRDCVLQAASARSSPAAALGHNARHHRNESALTGDCIVLLAGAEDAEREPKSLQAALCAIADEESVLRLLETLDTPDLQSRHRRLLELRDDSVSHDWMWRTSRAHGPVVPPGEFQMAVRLRLGATCVNPDIRCSRCGSQLGSADSHAMCCNLPEATRGHYDVRDEVLALAHLADPQSSIEDVGLVPSAPALRPADILTSAAIPGCSAALDIGVTSPDAAGAGADCCDAMHRRKHRDYATVLAELLQQGVTYRPMVWSAFGRAHPEAKLAEESLTG